MTARLMISDKRPMNSIASSRSRRYGLPVAANSAIGLGNPTKSRRNSAPITIAGAFFVPAVTCYGGCAWEAFVPAGFLDSRFTNLRTAATHSLGNERGSSSDQGATPMKHALIPSGTTVERQKAYCSHLLKTLLRYSSPSELARITTAIEAEVTKTLANRFNPGLNDARYDVYRRFWLKGGEA